MKTIRSSRLFTRAQTLLPGGVDSPVRAFKAVGASPLFIRRAAGARIEDIDGNTFIDYVMSWGPLIHGHAPKGLVNEAPLEARTKWLIRTSAPSIAPAHTSVQRIATTAVQPTRLTVRRPCMLLIMSDTSLLSN